jgi:WD40 repeat protein
VPELHPYATLRGHRLEVWSLALCPDHTTLVSGCKDGSVYVWDTATLRREQARLRCRAGACLGFLPDGQAIIALEGHGRVARWQRTSSRAMR